MCFLNIVHYTKVFYVIGRKGLSSMNFIWICFLSKNYQYLFYTWIYESAISELEVDDNLQVTVCNRHFQSIVVYW